MTLSDRDGELEQKIMQAIYDAKIHVFKKDSSYSTAEGEKWSVMVASEAVKKLEKLIQSECSKAALEARPDPDQLGTWVFIADIDRIKTLDDLYWSYIAEFASEQDPHRLDSPYKSLEYLKRNMPSASFGSVGVHKMLARADQRAKERIATLTQEKTE